MALQPISEQDIGRGVDAFHPENRIPAGFVETARNFDATAWGTLRKRVGYQAFAGYLPFRVSSISRNAFNVLAITLDVPAGALSALRSSPVILAGRVGSAAAGFSQTAITTIYSSTFTVVSGTTIAITNAGAAFGATAFEGCIWGVRPTELSFAAATTPAASTVVESVDYFRNALTQHPIAAYRGAFYRAISPGLNLTPTRPTVLSSRTPTGFTVVAGNAIHAVAHGLRTGDVVRISTSGTEPAGVMAGVDYHVIVAGADDIKLATSYPDALAGTFITISSSGTGTRTVLPGTVLAPLFIGTGDITPRTRGAIVSDDADLGWVAGTSITCAAGVVTFVLSLPSMAFRKVDGTLETTLSNLVTAGHDHLYVRDASFSSLNGAHRIQSITAGAVTLTVTVAVDGINLPDDALLPDTPASFSAGVFTDTAFLSELSLPAGAQVFTPTVPDDTLLSLLSASPVQMFVGELSVDPIILTYNDPVYSVAESLRTIRVTSPNGVMRGDGLWFSGLATPRRLRVQNVCPWTSETVTVSLDGGGFARFTPTGGTLPSISPGDILALEQTSATSLAYVGEALVVEIDGADVVFSVPTTASEAGEIYRLAGSVVSTAEEGVTFDSSVSAVSVPERWDPIEAVPRATTSSPNQTYTTYYTRGDAVSGLYRLPRSVMVGENMFIATDRDPMLKYDGTYLSAAGLPRWTPLLGVCQASDRTTGIHNLDRERDIADAVVPTNGTYTFSTTGDAADFNLGDPVTYSDRDPASQFIYECGFRVESTDAATTNAAGTSTKLRVSPTANQAFGATGDFFKRTFSRRYLISTYRRDANDRTCVTAPYSIQDAVVSFGADHRVDLLLAQMPLYPLFDYRRVETHVSISTGSAGDPSFTFGGLIPIVYTSAAPYRVFQDGIQPAEAALRNVQNTSLDILNNLFASDSGPAYRPSLERPPLARAITNVANRLVAANIRSYPRMTITAITPAGTSADPQALAGQTITISPDIGDTYIYGYVKGDMGGTGLSTSVNSDALLVLDMDGTYITWVVNGTTFTGLPNSIPDVAVGNWVQIFKKSDSRKSTRMDAALLGWFRIAGISGGPTNVIVVASAHKAKRQITNADAGTDLLTVVAHGLADGDPVQVSLAGGGGAPPAGTAAFTQYYARVASVDTFYLYTKFGSAVAGGAPDLANITGALTATTYLFYLDLGGGFASIAFASTRDSFHVPVVLHDTSSPGGPADFNDVDPRQCTLSDRIHTRESMLSLSIRELGRAVNGVASQVSFVPAPSTSQPGVYCAAYGNDASTPNTVELESFNTTSFGVFVSTGAATSPTWYFNGEAVSGAAAKTYRFPSRVAVSFRNFPEIFDQPFAQDAQFSNSAVDIGENDGDEVMAVIPKFGESFSNSALGQGAVLVLKSRAAYLLDANTRQVTQIETNGQGTDFPRSVILTKNGTEFANLSGLWKINQGNQCVFLGQILSRYWEQTVNRDPSLAAEVICGHHDARRNHALVSVPVSGATECTEVTAYDHTRENSDDRGSWTIYDNTPATGWANAGIDSLFGTAAGQAFTLRRAGDPSDYQDDTDPVGGLDIDGTARGAEIILPEKSFQMEGVRKRVTYVQLGFRSDPGVSADAASSIAVYASYDHTDTWEQLDTFTLVDPAAGTGDNISGRLRGAVTTLQFSLKKPKAEYLQIRIKDTAARRPVELVSVTYLAEVLTTGGVPTAATSK